MKILALVTPKPGATPEAMRTLLHAEVEHTWRSYKSGLVRELYLMGEGRPGAVLVLEAAGVVEAQAALRELPLVVGGVADVDCIALAPFTTLEALFAK